MNTEKIVSPTTDEVKKLLAVAINDKVIGEKTIGALLGMKLVESTMPKFNNEPDWDYKGLRQFFLEHGIESSDTIEEALKKLK